MTEDDLKAIEAREGAATEGPWDWLVHDHSMASLGVMPDPGLGNPLVLAIGPCNSCAKRVKDGQWKWGRCHTPNKDNAEFLAHARQDIPALTAHIREQEKRIAELEELVSERFAGNLASAMETKMAEIDHEWQPIETAPQDGTEVWVHVAAREGLPSFECKCAYHPDAGWCADEIRDVTHWNPHHD